MFPSDDNIEGHLLSSFYWGYALSQIPGGWLAAKFGAKWVLGCAVFVWSLATIGAGFTQKSVPILFALRVLVGLSEGANYPSQVEFMSRFVPHDERSRSWSFIVTGEAVGTILALLGGPFLAHTYGWQSIFYASGGLSILWLIFFLALIHASPERHPNISKEELALIRLTRSSADRNRSTPWLRILTNKQFIFLVCTHCCYNFGFYVCLSWISKFFSQAYGIDYSHLGLYSILPYILLFILCNTTGIVADLMEQRCQCSCLSNKADGKMSASCVRKTMNTIGMGGCALFFLLLACEVPAALVPVPSPGPPGPNASMLEPCNDTTQTFKNATSTNVATSATLLALAIGIGGVAGGGGYWPTIGDLSPEFSQVLVGISNSIASIPGIIGVSLVGNILSNSHNDWSVVFKVASIIEAVGALIFLFFVSAEDQHFETGYNNSIEGDTVTATPGVTNAKLERALLQKA